MTAIDRRCPNGHPAAADADFCTACGARVGERMGDAELLCPNGHVVVRGVAYCPTCGSKMDTTSVPSPPTVGFAVPPPTLGVLAPPDFAPMGAQGASGGSMPFSGSATSTPSDYGAWRTGYAFEPKGPVSGLAIAAFVVSLVWLYALTSIVAIVLAVIALRTMKERRERGRGLAIAAIILGAIGLLIGLGVLLTHTH